MFPGKKIIITATIIRLLIISGCVSTNPEKSSSKIPTINVTSYQANVIEGTNFTIQFEVSGGTNQGNISHAAVHWGPNRGGADIKDYGRFSKVYTGRVPQNFSVELMAPESGIIYFRAHAIIDGADIYSNEYEIRINPR